ncbi:MAG: polysaccharide pyruvyl transferase family protein [Clostridia bacterium]|nr:polysaccharide pyruvyl transferase family protein [Clostridia bacterium]
MKIGIVSMQRVLNYGSFMQALSLKRILESLDNEVVFVDYAVDVKIQNRNFTGKIKHRVGKLKALVKNIIKKALKRNRLTEKEHAFYDFYDMLGINQKRRYHTKVDVLLVGSDEVFNCLQDSNDVGFSMELFGKNNRAKKLISYAACFGNTTYDRLKEFKVEKIVAKHLAKFDAISVRDKNSFETVKTLIGKEPVCHMDPVFVGDLETLPWKETKKKDYIAVYGYAKRFTEDEKQIIKAFAQKQGLKTIALCEKQDFCDEFIRAGADEIISYFKNAKYVITETFHGTLFSVITHRPFVTIVRETINNSYGNQEKLEDLLTRMGAQDRKITNLDELEEKLLSPIDFEAIDKLRKEERQKTIEYLKKQTERI